MTISISKIANAFGSFFSSIAQNLKKSLEILGSSIWQNMGLKSVHTYNGIFGPVFFALKALKLKRTKVTGLDDIRPSLLRDASQYVAEPLTYIINLSLSSGIFPTQCKLEKNYTCVQIRKHF